MNELDGLAKFARLPSMVSCPAVSVSLAVLWLLVFVVWGRSLAKGPRLDWDMLFTRASHVCITIRPFPDSLVHASRSLLQALFAPQQLAIRGGQKPRGPRRFIGAEAPAS